MEKTILDIFGRPSHQPFAFYDPGSSSVRTSQATLLSDSTGCSPTLPKWGSMCGGALYELPTPALLTNGHGSSGLLRTPFAGTPNSHRGRPQGAAVRASQGHTVSVGDQIADLMLLPTPSASDSTGGEGPTREARQADGATGGPMLRDVGHLLPTPTVNDMGAGKTPEAWDEWTDKMREAHGNGNGHGKSLSIEAQRLLPTPETVNRKSRKAMTNGSADPANRTSSPPGLEQVAEMLEGKWPRDLPPYEDLPPATRAMVDSMLHRNDPTGAFTTPPSPDGSGSPEPPHPGQQTIEDA